MARVLQAQDKASNRCILSQMFEILYFSCAGEREHTINERGDVKQYKQQSTRHVVFPSNAHLKQLE